MNTARAWSNTARRLVLASALGVVPAAPAIAQNALGDGRALDRSLAQGTGGVNPLRRQENFRSRNLLITNNVIGGRGFRGAVGYTAEDAFRGATGTDEFFRFRADSAISSVNLLNYGTTYERLRFGQDAGLIEYQRVGQSDRDRTLTRGVLDQRHLAQTRLRVDRLSFESSLTRATQSAIEPTIIGAGAQKDGGRYVVQASSLNGLQTTPLNQLGQLLGLSTYDYARLADDVRAGRTDAGSIGRAYAGSYVDLLRPDSRLANAARDQRLASTAQPVLRAGETPGGEAEDEDETVPGTAAGDALTGAEGPGAVPTTGDEELDRIRARVAERYARMASGVPGAGGAGAESAPGPDEEEVKRIEADIQRLRRRLAGLPDEAKAPADSETPGGDRSRRLGVKPPPEVVPITGDEDEGEESDDAEGTAPSRPRSLQDFGLLLQHGQRIHHLAGGNPTRFNELMKGGEKFLSEGRYFWAERRFTRALRFTPGHPLATVGLAHAQIGAGLYGAASLTLRSLLVFQPEMIDVHYDPVLLPNHARLEEAVKQLEQRLEQAGRDRTADAFLYAYIGRLLGEEDSVRRGLTIMGEDAPGDPLLPLLRQIWPAD